MDRSTGRRCIGGSRCGAGFRPNCRSAVLRCGDEGMRRRPLPEPEPVVDTIRAGCVPSIGLSGCAAASPQINEVELAVVSMRNLMTNKALAPAFD